MVIITSRRDVKGTALIIDGLDGGRLDRTSHRIWTILRRTLRLVGIEVVLLERSGIPSPASSLEAECGQTAHPVALDAVRILFVRYRQALRAHQQSTLAEAILAMHLSDVEPIVNACIVAGGSARRTWVIVRDRRRARFVREACSEASVAASIVALRSKGRERGRRSSRSHFPEGLSISSHSVLFVAHSKAMAESLEAVARELVRTLDAPVCVVPPAASISYHRRPEVPDSTHSADLNCRPDGLWWLDQAAAERIRESTTRSTAATDVMRKVSPRIVVVGNDRCVEGLEIVSAARSIGALTITVQDGLCADVPAWWTSSSDTTYSLGPMLSEIHRRLGAPDEQYKPVGLTRGIDRLRSLSGDMGTAILLILQEHHGIEYFAALVELVRCALSQIGTVPVRIRFHPESSDAIKSLANKLVTRDEWSIDHTLGVAEALAGVRVVLGDYSTALVEAAIAGRLCGSYFAGSVHPPLDLVDLGVAKRVRTAYDMVALYRGGERERHRFRAAAYELLGDSSTGAASRIARDLAEAYRVLTDRSV